MARLGRVERTEGSKTAPTTARHCIKHDRCSASKSRHGRKHAEDQQQRQPQRAPKLANKRVSTSTWPSSGRDAPSTPGQNATPVTQPWASFLLEARDASGGLTPRAKLHKRLLQSSTRMPRSASNSTCWIWLILAQDCLHCQREELICAEGHANAGQDAN